MTEEGKEDFYRELKGELRTIYSLALPIIGGMLSQNAMNLIDTAMVGQLGEKALAVSGAGSFANFMAISIVMGLSAPVQAIAARRKGAGQLSSLAEPLNGGLFLAVLLGIPLTFALSKLAPVLFPLIQSDPEVTQAGIIYLQIRLLALTGIGCNFAFRGYWNGISLSNLYLKTVIYMQIANVIFNWLFIFGNLGFPRMGVYGAALGSTLATYTGTGYYSILAFRLSRKQGFLARFPSFKALFAMLKIATPAGLQRFAFAFGMTVFFSIIARAPFAEDFNLYVQGFSCGVVNFSLLGTSYLAASTVLVNLLLVGILPGVGFGIAAATLAGQDLGRKNYRRAERWGYLIAIISAISVQLALLPGVIFAPSILQIFSSEGKIIQLASAPLRMLFLTLGLDTVGLVFLNALQGVGFTRQTFVVAFVMQWLLALPLAFFVGPILGGGLLAIWGVQVGYRIVQGAIFLQIWRKGQWKKLKIADSSQVTPPPSE